MMLGCNAAGEETELRAVQSYAAYLRTLMPAGLLGWFRFPGQLSHEGIAERLGAAL